MDSKMKIILSLVLCTFTYSANAAIIDFSDVPPNGGRRYFHFESSGFTFDAPRIPGVFSSGVTVNQGSNELIWEGIFARPLFFKTDGSAFSLNSLNAGASFSGVYQIKTYDFTVEGELFDAPGTFVTKSIVVDEEAPAQHLIFDSSFSNLKSVRLFGGNIERFPFVNNIDVGSSNSLIQTPVPSAVWLFGSGLVGLIGMRRKKG